MGSSVKRNFFVSGSVADPNPEDPYVFGPPDSNPDPIVRYTDPDP